MFILYQLEDADALDQLIDPLLNLEEQLFHHIESIGKILYYIHLYSYNIGSDQFA